MIEPQNHHSLPYGDDESERFRAFIALRHSSIPFPLINRDSTVFRQTDSGFSLLMNYMFLLLRTDVTIITPRGLSACAALSQVVRGSSNEARKSNLE